MGGDYTRTACRIKCPYAMEPEYYVVHNTANDAPAANEVAYMIRNGNKVSFHYAVDDIRVVQGIPENRNAFHAGDGATGPGNWKGIGGDSFGPNQPCARGQVVTFLWRAMGRPEPDALLEKNRGYMQQIPDGPELEEMRLQLEMMERILEERFG